MVATIKISEFPDVGAQEESDLLTGLRNGENVNFTSNESGGGGVTSITAGTNLTGGTITTSGEIGLSPNPIVNTLTTTGLTASNFTQSYAPLTPPSGSNPYFFGDSICFGQNLPSPTTQRWSALLCAQFGWTEHNLAVTSSEWIDASTQIYNGLTGTNSPVFLSYGTNDSRAQTAYDQIQRAVESMTMYCCLKDSGRMVNARAATIIAGDWSATPLYTTIGLYTPTSSSPATLQATVNGRYVLMGLTMLPNSASSYPSLSVTIDGVAIQMYTTFLQTLNTSYLGANNPTMLFFYDTKSAPNTPHTVQVTWTNEGSFTTPTFVDWFCGMDNGMAGCNPVYLECIPDYNFFNDGEAAINTWQLDSMNNIYKRIARRFRYRHGLPVYVNYGQGDYGTCGLLIDQFHPNVNGQQYMKDNWVNFLQNGELNYLNS
jgi:lysophospholipase L1-like esterase